MVSNIDIFISSEIERHAYTIIPQGKGTVPLQRQSFLLICERERWIGNRQNVARQTRSTDWINPLMGMRPAGLVHRSAGY